MENVWQFMCDNWLSNRVFRGHDETVVHCSHHWSRLIDQPWRIMSIGLREWVHGFRSMGFGISLTHGHTPNPCESWRPCPVNSEGAPGAEAARVLQHLPRAYWLDAIGRHSGRRGRARKCAGKRVGRSRCAGQAALRSPGGGADLRARRAPPDPVSSRLAEMSAPTWKSQSLAADRPTAPAAAGEEGRTVVSRGAELDLWCLSNAAGPTPLPARRPQAGRRCRPGDGRHGHCPRA
jgi:hypothetical protein